jgi:hypothetical protein
MENIFFDCPDDSEEKSSDHTETGDGTESRQDPDENESRQDNDGSQEYFYVPAGQYFLRLKTFI